MKHNICKQDSFGSLFIRNDANVRTIAEKTKPVSLACCRGHADVVAALLDKPRDKSDANLFATDIGDTPLWKACSKSYVNVVSILPNKVREKIDVNRLGPTVSF